MSDSPAWLEDFFDTMVLEVVPDLPVHETAETSLKLVPADSSTSPDRAAAPEPTVYDEALLFYSAAFDLMGVVAAGWAANPGAHERATAQMRAKRPLSPEVRDMLWRRANALPLGDPACWMLRELTGFVHDSQPGRPGETPIAVAS